MIFCPMFKFLICGYPSWLGPYWCVQFSFVSIRFIASLKSFWYEPSDPAHIYILISPNSHLAEGKGLSLIMSIVKRCDGAHRRNVKHKYWIDKNPYLFSYTNYISSAQ